MYTYARYSVLCFPVQAETFQWADPPVQGVLPTVSGFIGSESILKSIVLDYTRYDASIMDKV
jgi:hypothetical protein